MCKPMLIGAQTLLRWPASPGHSPISPTLPLAGPIPQRTCFSRKRLRKGEPLAKSVSKALIGDAPTTISLSTLLLQQGGGGASALIGKECLKGQPRWEVQWVHLTPTLAGQCS